MGLEAVTFRTTLARSRRSKRLISETAQASLQTWYSRLKAILFRFKEDYNLETVFGYTVC